MMAQYPEDWQPPEEELWSIPPIITDTAPLIDDQAIRLRQGIVCEVKLDTEYLFQNINMNEDDLIDFSFHGDKDGVWGQLNTHAFVRVKKSIFFLNRTHKDVLYLATFQQEIKLEQP